MFLVTTAMIFKYRPFENKLMTFLTLVNEVCYIVLLMFFLGLVLGKESIDEETKYYKIGYPMIIFMALTILINLVVCLIETFLAIKELI